MLRCRRKAAVITVPVNEWRHRRCVHDLYVSTSTCLFLTRWCAFLLPHIERPAVTLSAKTLCHGECTPSNQDEKFLLLLWGHSSQALSRAHPLVAVLSVPLLPWPTAVVPPNVLMHGDTAAILPYPHKSTTGFSGTVWQAVRTNFILLHLLWFTNRMGTLRNAFGRNNRHSIQSEQWMGASPFFSPALLKPALGHSPGYCGIAPLPAVHIVSPLLFSPCFWAKTRHCPECIDAGSKSCGRDRGGRAPQHGVAEEEEGEEELELEKEEVLGSCLIWDEDEEGEKRTPWAVNLLRRGLSAGPSGLTAEERWQKS